MKKIVRSISIFCTDVLENSTDNLLAQIILPEIEIEKLKSIINERLMDPELYDSYVLSESQLISILNLFPNYYKQLFNFDKNKFEYFLEASSVV